ncbi:hypothetical protein F5888DRAFT_1659810 [Russula emetica]|nr:hypothetical protein F5888DRAFT_1659810 [Russula emetica]
MLSRFSSLFTYVIVGLVISAAATPLNPLGDTLGGGTQSLSRPQAMKPYGDNKAKPYGGQGDNKPYDDDMNEPQGQTGQCSVGNQHCCNQVNEATETSRLDSLGPGFFGLPAILGVIKGSNQLWGFDCTPAFGGNNMACSNQQVCCQDNHFNGLIVVGCNNINL